MTPPLRLAVLECDTPLDRTRAAYGGYGGVFEALLNAGADLLASTNHQPRPQLEVTKYDVVNAEVYPDLDSVDAVLLTGSRASPSFFHLSSYPPVSIPIPVSPFRSAQPALTRLTRAQCL